MTGPGTPDEDATAVIARIGAESEDPAGRTAPSGTGSASAGMRTARTSGVVRAGSTMAVATLVSRITGFVAKVVLLAFYGFWIVGDSYGLANTLPNIIFELLVGGVLASVAIPLLSRARSDPDGGQRYTQQLMSLAIVALLLATAAAMAAAPLLTRLYLFSSDADPTLATHLAYLLLPQIFFYGIAALFGAILNTKERFAAPAWAPVVNNLVVIGVGAMLLVLPDSGAAAKGLATLSGTQFFLLGAGTTAGIVLQAAVLLPAVWRAGFRFRWRWGLDSRMREAGRLMGWAVVYALVSQAGYIVTVWVAWGTRHGFYALYNFGSMLFQLPYGLLGVSLLTAIMPRMSRHAAAGEMDAVKHDMGVANRLSSVALLPVTAAMIALAVPLAIVTSKYGRASDPHTLGMTLAAFAIGLLPLAVTLVQMRVFYAMKDGRTPALINLVMVAVRIPLLLACRALPEQWVVPGLALAMSISYVVGVLVGEVWLRIRFGPMGSGRTLVTVGKVALASALGGVVAWWVVDRLLPLSGGTVAQAVVQLVIGGLVGLVVVAAVMLLLRVDEVRALRRRLLPGARGGRPPGPGASDDGQRGAPDGVPTGARHGTLVGAPTQQGPTRQGQVSVTDERDNTPRGTGDPDPEATVAHARAVPARTPHSEPIAFAPGAVIGERYRLVSLVATDASGNRFWRARDTVLPRDMAVTLLPETPQTAATVSRTLRAGRLHHIGLPQTLDVGTVEPPRTDRTGSDRAETDTTRSAEQPDGPGTPGTGGAAYIAGQWVDGATLTDLLTGGPLDAEVATTLTARIADAVGEAHRNGIALGAVHPSLVRVNFDGQVRLSHVIAHSGATTDTDIRAVGALLYLMLTGTWPLAAADGAPQLEAAPTRGGREVPAVEVNPSAPVALSALADRMLHPDEPQGIHAIGAITALLRPPAPPRPAASGTAAAAGAPAEARVLGPAERALVKERRIKLSIAGAMLTALAVLIVIVVASLISQFLTGITEPIKAADQERVIPTTAYTTTRTVGVSSSAPETGSASTGQSVTQTRSTGPTTTPTTTHTTTSAPPGKPVAIREAVVYDPQGTPPKDYTSRVDLAFDGEPSTAWPTWVYKQQFGIAQGGLKDGVGLVLTLDKAVVPRSVTVSTSTPGTTVEIRSTEKTNPALDATTVLGTAELGTDPVSITLKKAPRSKYVLLWITKLAPYSGDSAKNQGSFQSEITEISVVGS